MNKKILLFTFDYELFLGEESGSVDNCMIIPTNKVVEILDSFNLKGIFFVDCTYLFQLKNKAKESVRALEDFKKIENQLQKLLHNNHYVYPHIHSHWVDAKYDSEKNQWNLSNIEKYRFDSLSEEEKENVFRKSCDCLMNIIQAEKTDYKMDAYRAGGWCIQPFSNFYNFFKEYQIIADFSVLGGSKKNTNAIKFDFSSIGTNSLPYYFNQNDVLKSDKGEFKEYPITSVEINKISLFNKIINKILWRTHFGQGYGDGRGVPFISNIKNTEYDDKMEMVSVELLTHFKLSQYKLFLKNHIYIQFISHPKMISPYNLFVLKKFLIDASNKYEINSDWKKIIL